MKTLLASFAVLAALAVGCDDPEETSEAAATETAETAPGPQSDVPLTEQMHENYVRTVVARDALITGELDQAKAEGRSIAGVEPSADLPPPWRPFATRMRDRARALGGAPNLDVASLEVGKLGAVCGDCHAQLNIDVTFEAPPLPEGDDTATHMLRHQWAADRLWEGLVAPDDGQFTGGASALVEAPLHPSALAPNMSVPEEIAELAVHVHELGDGATRATEPADQAQFYGELLATCESCHVQLDAP